MSKNHVKPEKEELEANALKAAAEAEAMMEEEKKKNEVPPVEDSPKEEVVEDKQEISEDEKPEEKKEEVPATDDYKKKFIASSKEALIIRSANKKIEDAVDKASTLPEPTEEELKKEYPDYLDMTPTEQMFAKKTYVNERRFALIHDATKEGRGLKEWSDKVETFIEDPKNLIAYPDLEGKEDDFKIFALKETRRGIDFQDLVGSFLFESGKKPTVKKPAMFDTGTGGDNEKAKPKTDKISLEQARQLRNTDYNKYKELLRDGKIDLDTF